MHPLSWGAQTEKIRLSIKAFLHCWSSIVLFSSFWASETLCFHFEFFEIKSLSVVLTEVNINFVFNLCLFDFTYIAVLDIFSTGCCNLVLFFYGDGFLFSSVFIVACGRVSTNIVLVGNFFCFVWFLNFKCGKWKSWRDVIGPNSCGIW